MWVTFFHLGFPLTFSITDRSSLIYKIIGATIDCFFCGPAAVIVFFVISGFCIHFPYRNERNKLNILSFIISRYIRILTPLLICIGLVNSFGMNYDTVGRLVGWSIECELIYYSLYPIILLVGRKFSWLNFVMISFPIILIIVLPRNPTAMMYPSFGLFWNALLGLPCWLLGCMLAEQWTPSNKTSKIIKYIWRIVIIIFSMLTFSLMLHAQIGFPWTLNIFALAAFFWLKNELNHNKENCFSILEWAGKWSYSLYMMHGPVAILYNRVLGFQDHESLNATHWLIRLLIVLVISYIFYLVFEKPSHKFARYISHNIKSINNAVSLKFNKTNS